MQGFGALLFEIRQGLVGMFFIAAVLLGVAMVLMTLARWIRNRLPNIGSAPESLLLEPELAEDFD